MSRPYALHLAIRGLALRPFLLKEGRDDYLAFIRNVPSQGLLGFFGTVFIHGGIRGDPSVQTAVAGIIAWAMAGLAALWAVYGAVRGGTRVALTGLSSATGEHRVEHRELP